MTQTEQHPQPPAVQSEETHYSPAAAPRTSSRSRTYTANPSSEHPVPVPAAAHNDQHTHGHNHDHSHGDGDRQRHRPRAPLIGMSLGALDSRTQDRGPHRDIDIPPRSARVCPTDQENIDPVRHGGPRGLNVDPDDVDVDRSGRRAGEAAEVKVLDKRSLEYVLRSGLAGGLAGCAGKTIVGPLDRVKILFQTSNPQFARYSSSWFGVATAMKDINSHEGIRGLFKGHSATLLRIFPYAAIKFLAYEQIRANVIPTRDKETPFRRLISGSMAGMTSVFFTYPLELVRVRLAFETKHGMRSSLTRICRQIYHEHWQPAGTTPTSSTSSTSPSTSTATSTTKPHLPTPTAIKSRITPQYGLSNFYRGFSPTLLGMLPYAGISFLTHDTVGDWLRHSSLAAHTTIPQSQKPSTSTDTAAGAHHTHRLQLTASAELFSGAMAGVVSQTSSYPLEVIRRRMQVGGAVGDGRRMGIVETAGKIFAERGVRGFWVGLTIGYMKVVPMTATAFFVYERAKWWLRV
ncbi:hypothetical protein FQN50_005135 [Emmonsiellopsis sp. PD_5]|nr:hypothetical protein FQN50_005135 [Emmonsiellopsis sp. PD_5]